MDQVPAATVLALCQKYGPQLICPAGLDGAKVMAAIAANESSTGANCGPRFEPSYFTGGANCKNEQIPLVKRFGRAAACSYGPWQVLPCNAMQYTPQDLQKNPETCAKAFVAYFNNYIVRRKEARTLEQIAMVYNHGHIDLNPPSGVQQYMDQVRAHYEKVDFSAPAPATHTVVPIATPPTQHFDMSKPLGAK